MSCPQVVIANSPLVVQTGADSGPLNVAGCDTLVFGVGLTVPPTGYPTNFVFYLDALGPDGTWYELPGDVNANGAVLNLNPAIGVPVAINAYGESKGSRVPFTSTVRLRWNATGLTFSYWVLGQ